MVCQLPRPQPGHHCPPTRGSPSPSHLSLSLRVCALVLAPCEHPTRHASLPAPRSSRAPHATLYGAGQRCPAPYCYTPHAGGQAQNRAHANKPTPEREHASKQAGARRRDHTVPPPPSKRANTKSANTHTNTGSSANTQPNHPPSKHAHNKPKLPPPARTQEAPTR